MKKFLFVILLLACYGAHAQWTTIASPQRFTRGLGVPVRDTIATAAADSAQLVIRPQDGKMYYRHKSAWRAVEGGGGGSTTISWDSVIGKPVFFPTSWDSVAGKPYVPPADTFTTNPTILGTSFGKYGNGSTPNWTGLTPRQAILDAIVQAIPPTYFAPTASISSSPASGNYEIGTNLGTITLSSTFTQNDAGAATGTTYAKFVSSWNNLGGNTDALGTLTQQTYYRVTISYGQGACKNNNLGVPDCTGRIQAGSVTSGNILFNPFYKRYWGFASSQAPDNSTILALSQDNNGTTGALSLSNVTPSGSQYFVYFTRGTVSSVTVNGFPATEAFTITTYSVTNAQGFTSTYSYVYSNNLQTGTINSIVIN